MFGSFPDTLDIHKPDTIGQQLSLDTDGPQPSVEEYQRGGQSLVAAHLHETLGVVVWMEGDHCKVQEIGYKSLKRRDGVEKGEIGEKRGYEVSSAFEAGIENGYLKEKEQT
ncbi:hypothetical protein L218DRAFT_1082376 [Marasmius fiardii PR-910]|nr:hypothetical protein L218DRAFT_1082376 [Marasmius fiardii PR-910]